MKTLDDYTVVVMSDDGTFLAYAPAIHSCHAVGTTAAEARAGLDNVFEMIVEQYAEKGWELPDDIGARAFAYAGG